MENFRYFLSVNALTDLTSVLPVILPLDQWDSHGVTLLGEAGVTPNFDVTSEDNSASLQQRRIQRKLCIVWTIANWHQESYCTKNIFFFFILPVSRVRQDLPGWWCCKVGLDLSQPEVRVLMIMSIHILMHMYICYTSKEKVNDSIFTWTRKIPGELIISGMVPPSVD